MSEPRIVTLLASATEIVCALGYQDALVARSHECDHPLSVRRLPASTESTIDPENSSRDRDDQALVGGQREGEPQAQHARVAVCDDPWVFCTGP